MTTQEPPGTTPITWEEERQLRPTWVATRADLNEVEQQNILAAQSWAQRTRVPAQVLEERFLLELHRRMFGEVWRWAGRYRTTARNLGVEHWQIRTEVRDLLADAGLWVALDTQVQPDEAAVRFHHRWVAIHPFPNGNGRHARLAADLLARSLGRPAFTWGRVTLVDRGTTRDRYLAALRTADAHDVGPLLAFARS